MQQAANNTNSCYGKNQCGLLAIVGGADAIIAGRNAYNSCMNELGWVKVADPVPINQRTARNDSPPPSPVADPLVDSSTAIIVTSRRIRAAAPTADDLAINIVKDGASWGLLGLGGEPVDAYTAQWLLAQARHIDRTGNHDLVSVQ